MSSLKTKLRLMICLLVLLSIVTVTGLTSLLFYRNSVSQAKENIVAIADAYKQTVENKTSVFRNELKQVGILSSIKSTTLSEEESASMKNTDFKRIYISDASGKTGDNTDISGLAYFQHAAEGETYISSPIDSKREEGKLSIIVSTPVNNNTSFKGVVLGELDHDVFNQVISEIKIGEGGYVSQVTALGRVHSGSSAVNLLDDAVLAQTIEEINEGCFYELSFFARGEGAQVGFTASVIFETPGGDVTGATITVRQQDVTDSNRDFAYYRVITSAAPADATAARIEFSVTAEGNQSLDLDDVSFSS